MLEVLKSLASAEEVEFLAAAAFGDVDPDSVPRGRETMALTAFSNFGRAIITRRPQPRHLRPKSMPVRVISHWSEPQGWAFFILTMSPTS